MAYDCQIDCGFQGDRQQMAHYGDCRSVVSLENTLRLLSYASCVLCMCWIKYLSHLASFPLLHIVQLQKFGQNEDMIDLFCYYWCSLSYLKTQWNWLTRVERFLFSYWKFWWHIFKASSLIFVNNLVGFKWYWWRDILIQESIWLDRNVCSAGWVIKIFCSVLPKEYDCLF